jgi:two-component system cell cycle sensor histidine kinase PleC
MSPITPFAITSLPRPDSDRDNAPARMVLALDGTIIFANAGFLSLAGMQKLEGRNFFKIASFADADEAFRDPPLLFGAGKDVFLGLREGAHEISFLTAPGKTLLQFTQIKNGEGRRYVLVSALEQDEGLTRHFEEIVRKAETQIRESAGRFLELSSDLLCLSDEGGALENVNEKFSALLGYTQEDLSGEYFFDLVHPDDRAAVRTAMQDVLREETNSPAIDFESRVLSKEALIFCMEWKCRKIEGKIYMLGRDITAAKKHEQELLKRERQLSEAEAIGHMGHWHWTIGQQEIRFSDEIFRIFGVTRGRFKPTLESVNALLHRRDAGRMLQAFQRAIIQQNDHEIDFRVITPSGETRHIRCQGRCEFDAAGDVTGLYGIMQDVTDIVRHERELTEAKDSAERAYAAKSQFLAHMSHELRTPLNAIIGFSEMMQQQLLGPIGNERYIDYIKGIRESGEHLLDLISDILDMSKIEAGKYELDIENINLSKVVRLAVHMMEGKAQDSGIRLSLSISDENLHVLADRRAVMQMMLNLLSNAVKFSKPGGKVEIDVAQKDENIFLKVKDHGIGIPAHKLGSVTNPFEQVSSQYTRSHEGTGLGLSITKELAELHGGGLHIESVVDVGTTVTIRLPLKANRL